MKEAKKSLEKNELAQFYSNLAAGLFGYLETKLRIPKSEFTLDKAEEKMKALNIPVDLISEVRKVAEKSEYVRFAPSSADGVSGQELYEDTVKLIVKLESKIGKVK